MRERHPSPFNFSDAPNAFAGCLSLQMQNHSMVTCNRELKKKSRYKLFDTYGDDLLPA
jgi:hypothetical protein